MIYNYKDIRAVGEYVQFHFGKSVFFIIDDYSFIDDGEIVRINGSILNNVGVSRDFSLYPRHTDFINGVNTMRRKDKIKKIKSKLK